VVDTQRRAGSKRKACPEADETAEALAQTTTALAAGGVMVKSLESTIDDAIQNDPSKLPALGRLILSMRTLMNALIAARERSHVTTMVSVSYQIMQLQNEEVSKLIGCIGKS
jgi:energy-converting hydrogenase Eha subunit B